MEDRLGAAEARFADLIWEREPVSSGELARLAGESLGWKKSTVYTVLRRLCDKGLFENEGGTVRARLSREAYAARRSGQFVSETFGGSLPAFLAAFTAGRKLTEQEIEELQGLIDRAREGDG